MKNSSSLDFYLSFFVHFVIFFTYSYSVQHPVVGRVCTHGTDPDLTLLVCTYTEVPAAIEYMQLSSSCYLQTQFIWCPHFTNKRTVICVRFTSKENLQTQYSSYMLYPKVLSWDPLNSWFICAQYMTLHRSMASVYTNTQMTHNCILYLAWISRKKQWIRWMHV